VRLRPCALLAFATSAVTCAFVLAGPAAASTAVPAIAAGTASAAAPGAAADGFGWLRLAHLSPNTPAVDVYLYSFGDPRAFIVLKRVAYGTVSPYERVASGDYTVAMRGVGAAPTSKPVLSTSVDVAAGNAYTVAGMGPYKALRLQVLHDQLTTPRGQALVRIIQASLTEPVVTVSMGTHAIASKLAFAKVTGYLSVPPGTALLHVAGGGQHATMRTRFAAGSIHTVVVLDDPGKLSIRVLEDAAGAAQAPLGGAATGFGGTAPQPGPALLPWVAAMICGLLLALAGLARLSRPAGKKQTSIP
jgi:Domain of unknown function (DUF4397)